MSQVVLKDVFGFVPAMNRNIIGKVILKKWTDRDSQLIRFLNGNTKDCSSNLCYVDDEDAMVNFDTWVTDWDSGLTEEEKALVQDKSWRRGLVFFN